MEEPYGEGPATHTGPEPCVVGGSAQGEALTCVRADTHRQAGEDAGQPARFVSCRIRTFLF